MGGCSPRRPVPVREALPRLRSITEEEARAYAGSRACAECHAQESRQHAVSQHAHALTEVSAATHGYRFRRPSDKLDPVRGTRYQTTVSGSECLLTVEHAGQRDAVPARFGFGSGKHATTYLGDYRGKLLELRLSYYSGAHRWDFSPGQQVDEISGGVLYPVGLVKADGVVEECFVCHSTTVVKSEGRIRPDLSLPGVGCESCHGPGRGHIEAVRTGASDLKMRRLSEWRSELTTQLCGQCHRSPAGEDLSDPFNRTQLPRLQGLALSQSACFTNSGGRLSCLTCHDPHSDANTSRAFYNQKCADCHTGGADVWRPCSIAPAGDCVSCHMPEQPVGMPTGLKYRTHQIKVWGVR